MLSSPRRRPRPVRQQSLRQEYEEFVLQRIEEHKEQLSREEILTIADEAVRELEIGSEDQLLLTEVLLLEHVDRVIVRRLKLPTFRKWRQTHIKLRESQRDPLHWGLDADSPLRDFALRLEASDSALLIGRRAASAGFYLAAHGWPALVIDQDIQAVEAVEHRAAAEELGTRIQALVVGVGGWFPDIMPSLVVIDPAALTDLDGAQRATALDTFKDRTVSGGIHYVLPSTREERVLPLAMEALQENYSDWWVQRLRNDNSSAGFRAVKP